MENTYLIVGLGNPGDKYIETRHNVGFKAIEELQKQEQGSFSEWKLSKNFHGLLSEGKYQDKKIFLLEPLTFMNLSGKSVAVIAGFYKIKPENIIVIHDDKDMQIGSFRIRDMGSAGGHNGIKSISQDLGTNNFGRFKIGVSSELIEHMETADFVLSRFTQNERKTVNTLIEEKVILAIYEYLESGLISAQNEYSS